MNKEVMINNKGGRITIREWQVQDFAPYRYWHDGIYEWMKYNGPYYPKKTMEEIDQEIDLLKDETDSFPSKRMVIADKNSNKLIGTISWYWQSEETNWISIGLALYDDNQWGKGLGRLALELWIDMLFKEFKDIVRLDLRTWSGNIGMMKLAEKIGFQLEARFRNARIVEGKYYDSIGYGMLREEWNESNKELN